MKYTLSLLITVGTLAFPTLASAKTLSELDRLWVKAYDKSLTLKVCQQGLPFGFRTDLDDQRAVVAGALDAQDKFCRLAGPIGGM